MIDDLQLARAVRETALATAGVHSMGSGRYAEAATYGAGEKVTGVVVDPSSVRVHIIARYPLTEPIPSLAERVRERVALRTEGRPAMIVVEDLEVEQNENL
ncbi:MAG: hypothetical protein M3P37_10135 [Actinomycetota bacterium]|nr:hypothetical protein [Actinomycetota bacterium]